MIELFKIESTVVQMALKGMTLEEIAAKTKLKIQSIRKLLEFAKKRLNQFSSISYSLE